MRVFERAKVGQSRVFEWAKVGQSKLKKAYKVNEKTVLTMLRTVLFSQRRCSRSVL